VIFYQSFDSSVDVGIRRAIQECDNPEADSGIFFPLCFKILLRRKITSPEVVCWLSHRYHFLSCPDIFMILTSGIFRACPSNRERGRQGCQRFPSTSVRKLFLSLSLPLIRNFFLFPFFFVDKRKESGKACK